MAQFGCATWGFVVAMSHSDLLPNGDQECDKPIFISSFVSSTITLGIYALAFCIGTVYYFCCKTPEITNNEDDDDGQVEETGLIVTVTCTVHPSLRESSTSVAAATM